MVMFLYLFRAFGLLRYLASSSHRKRTHDRWKVTPTHSIIYEVGGGIMGLIVLAALMFLILANRR
jgi:hypothetical protein